MTTELQLFVEAMGWTLLHSLWQASAIALAVAGALRWMRQRSPQSRYALVCVGLLGMLVASASTFVSQWASAVPESSTARASASPAGAPAPGSAADSETTAPSKSPASPPSADAPRVEFTTNPSRPPAEPIAGSTTIPDVTATSPRIEPALPWVVAAWSLGVALLSLRLLSSWLCLRRWRSRGEPLTDPAWRERIAALREAMRVSRPVRVLASASAGVPMVVGWFRPVILVPASLFTGMSAAQLEAIFAHELAHIRRHDYLVNLIQNTAETLFFFHPAVWWLSSEIRKEREHCCDDAAAAQCGGAVNYAGALAALEESRRTPGTRPQGAISAASGSLLQRVRRLLGVPFRDSSPGVSWSAGVALALLAASWLVGSHLAQAAPEPESPDEETEKVVEIPDAPEHDMSKSLLIRWEQLEGTSSPLPESRVAGVRRAIGQWIAEDRPPKRVAEKLERFGRWQSGRDEHPAAEVMAWLYAIADVHPQPIQLAFNHEPTPGRAVSKEQVEALNFGPAGPNGLRAAFTLSPERDGYVFGDVVYGHLTLWNTGDKTLITGNGLGPGTTGLRPDLQLRIRGENGRTIIATGKPHDPINFTAKRKLEPGQAAVIGGYILTLGEGEERQPVHPIKYSSDYKITDLRSGEKIKIAANLPYPKAPDDAKAYPGLQTGDFKFTIRAAEDVKVWVANRPGTWPMADGSTLHLEGKLYHAADISTTGTLSWPDGREVLFYVAADAFANREPWAMAWEAGDRVLWIATGKLISFRDLAKIKRPHATQLKRIDFRHPGRVTETRYSGWPAEGGPSADCRAGLEKHFVIPAGRQHASEVLHPKNQPPAAKAGPDVRGIDLGAFHWDGDITTVAELYERVPDHPGDFRKRDGVFFMSLGKVGPWLFTAANSGQFYIEVRRDPEVVKDDVYGPIPGDPVEALDLSGWLEDSPNHRDPGYARRAARDMLACGDESLGKLALEWFGEFQPPSPPRSHDHIIDAVREHLRHNPQSAIAEQARVVLAQLESMKAEATQDWESKREPLPDGQYSPGELAGDMPPGIVWGEPHANGLRLGLKGVASGSEWPLGSYMDFDVFLRNDGLAPVKFAWTPRLDEGVYPALERDGVHRQASIVVNSTLLFHHRCRVDPGHFIKLKSGARYKIIKVNEDGTNPESASGLSAFLVDEAAAYKLEITCSLGVPDWVDSRGNAHRRPKGEWEGGLHSKPIPILITDPDAPAKDPAAPADTVAERIGAIPEAKPGKRMSEQWLHALPFGPAAENGLRVARFFNPMRATYEIGEKVEGRIMFHNTGRNPVEFTTADWHQRDTWHCRNAAGEQVQPMIAERMGFRAYPRFRLKPGEVCEVAAQGTKIGSVPFDDEPGSVYWTVDLPAKPGDTLTCSWDVTLQLAEDKKQSRLRSGDITFKTEARPADFPVDLGVSRHLGKFHLTDRIKLQRSRGQKTTATIEWDDGREHVIELTHGGELEPIVWWRGGSAFWIVSKKQIRKIDFANPDAVQQAGWPWEEAPADFGGAPELVRAEIVKLRPDAQTRLEIRAPGAYRLSDKSVIATVTAERDGREVRNELSLRVKNAAGVVISDTCALPFGENTWAVLVSKDGENKGQRTAMTVLTSSEVMQFGFRNGHNVHPGFSEPHESWHLTAADLAAGKQPPLASPEELAWAKRVMPEIVPEEAYASGPEFEIRLVCDKDESPDLVRPTYWATGRPHQRIGRFVRLGERLLRGDELEPAGIDHLESMPYLYRARESRRTKWGRLREQFAGRSAAIVVDGKVTETFSLRRDVPIIRSNRVKHGLLPEGAHVAPYLDRTVGDWDEMLSGHFTAKQRERALGLGLGKADVPVPDDAIPMLLALVKLGQGATKCRCLGTLRKTRRPQRRGSRRGVLGARRS